MALRQVRPGLQLRRVESVNPGERVRHVDQLTERELELFEALVGDDEPVRVDGDTPLSDGEIITFTDFYRVERV